MTPYQQYIHKSRYARWREEDGRRETFEETVDRLIEYYKKEIEKRGVKHDLEEVREYILNLQVMPSMRAMMTAGPALDRCHVPAYNCAYVTVDSPRTFDETMYVLMCGTGVGFSVEEKNTHKLPSVPEELQKSNTQIVVEDSKEGWATAFKELISMLYSGTIPKYDVSLVRPEGAKLRTFGGRASGPAPLVDLFEFTINIFKQAVGRRLTTLECHDLMCKIADIVVVGGVRRSAMISLSDVTDDRMRDAKTGNWWDYAGHRRLANNSAVYENRRPDMNLFMKEWKALYDSKSGERGIFSRYACQRIAKEGGRDANHDFGTNPCSEIILRPFQFCNLSEIVVRADDDFNSLAKKAEIATILGTIQSTFTEFTYLRKIWKENCEEERLLGVSLTGVCDNLELLSPGNLQALKDVVLETNAKWAGMLGVNVSAATTCVKPSGTVSQLVLAGKGGLHAQHSNFYLRTIRADNKDPITQFMKDEGVYNEPDVMAPNTTTVFYFGIKAPEGAVTRDTQTVYEALELWKNLQDNWCEHKPSATIDVREEEWMGVGAWTYENFDSVSGISYLPYDGGSYKQAPYQAVSEEEFDEFMSKHPTPELDWTKLSNYEWSDETTGSQELACSAGGCEI